MFIKRPLLSLLLATVFVLSGCGVVAEDSNTGTTSESKIQSVPTNNDGYILTSETGTVILKNNKNEEIDRIELSGTINSQYIFAKDEAVFYSSILKTGTGLGEVFYGIDKSSRILTVFSVSQDQLIKGDEYILESGSISNMYAYGGMVYYQTSDEIVKAPAISFAKRQIVNEDGTVTYAESKQLKNDGRTNIYILNLSEDFLDASGYRNYLSEIDLLKLDYPDMQNGGITIPSETTTWIAGINKIFFFSKQQMGIYNIQNNEISVYDGCVNVTDALYAHGIGQTIKIIADFGMGSDEAVVADLSTRDLSVKNLYQIDHSEPTAIYTSTSSDYVYALFKTTISEKYFSQLRIFDATTNKELYVTAIEDYQPTKIIAYNDSVILFNPYENNFLTGSVNSASFRSTSKLDDGIVMNNIFIVGEKYINPYYYDDQGRTTDSNGRYIDTEGNLIDEDYNYVNASGQKIDILGRAVNDDGALIDSYNNIIDETGKILTYTIHNDGYCYDSNGNKVDTDGTPLVKNDDGDWVRADAVNTDIEISGHYDEYGNFIIDSSVLEKYPNAYDLIN